jgi:ABC-2 type transport system permease protein
MAAAWQRIAAMVERYVVLHIRSTARLFEIFFWPVMELFVWGFFTVYLRKEFSSQSGTLVLWLLTGMIFWDVLFRSQQSVSLALMEELWSRNVLNLFISPLRRWEWVASAALYGLLKTSIIVATLMLLAVLFYAYPTGALGILLVPFMGNLLLMGWALGLFTSGLLVRWGHAAEALVWGVPFLIQPFSAIFYPLSVYPSWLKPFCLMLPSTHVMEGMRAAAGGGGFSWTNFGLAFGMNLVFMAGGGWFYVRMLERGRENGQLVRMTA